MVTQRNRMIRILVLLSLFAWSLNGMAIPALFVNGAASASAEHGNDFAKSERVRPEANASSRARLADIYGKLPMSFEANDGQFDSQVRFASRGRGYALFLTGNEAVIALSRPVRDDPSSDYLDQLSAPALQPFDAPQARGDRHPLSESNGRIEMRRSTKPPSVLRMKLIGSRPSPRAERMDELPGKSNYFIGNDPTKWRTNVSNYAKVRYRSVYRGIDLVYYGDQGSLEYDFNVSPGADPRAIRLRFDGAERVRIDETGDLVLSTSGGEVHQHKPVVYQEVNGARKEIKARYVVKSRNQIGFEVGRYDASRRLVIDPLLSYSTYVGGSDDEIGNAIAADSSGNIFITGQTHSADFPVTPGAYQTTFGGDLGNGDAFVTKLNAAGSARIYSTYLGGSDDDSGKSIAVDATGNAYISGTGGPPVTPGAYQTPSGNIFVTKLNPSGSALVYSSHFGGGSTDFVNALAVDGDGAVYVTGFTQSNVFPTTPGAFQTSFSGTNVAFISKLNPNGTALVYSTFLGNESFCRAIAVDSSGNAYVTGEFTAVSFPTTPAAFQPDGSGVAPFVTKLNPAGSALVYSTLLGSSNGGSGRGICVDGSGSAYVTGLTQTPDFPLFNPLQPSIGGSTFFRSSDAGGSWNASATGLNNREVTCLVIDPITPSTIYAGARGGIFKSTNGGSTWSAVNAGLTNINVNALAVTAATPLTLYAGTEKGLFKSTNAGASWSSINSGVTSAIIDTVAVDSSAPSIIYAGAGGYAGGFYITGGAFKSTDGGENWTAINNGFVPAGITVNSIVIDPVSSSIVYAGASPGFFRSTNAGASWSQLGAALVNRNVQTIAIDPSNPATIYAGTLFSGGVGAYKSTDGGNSWTGTNNGLLNPQIRVLRVDPLNPSTLYAGTAGGGAYKSIDGASHWSYIGASMTGTNVGALAIDPTNSLSIYAGTSNRPDAFVTKLNPTGSALEYSTFLGGNKSEVGNAIAVDSAGDAFITGQTTSDNFPTANALQPSSSGLPDAFVVSLNAAGNTFAYSTYFGGSDFDTGSGIALDLSGNAYALGATSSTNFPTTPGAYQTAYGGGLRDAFVAKIASSPTSVKLSSFQATGYDEGVYLKWETGFEAENLGFNIYREMAGKRVLVNPELVAGSALRAGARTKLQAGQSYAWWDKGIADCGVRIANCPDAQYWLEEIDLDGTRTMYGPFSVHRVGGEPSREKQADLLSRLGTGDPLTREMPLTYQTAREHQWSAGLSAMSFVSQSSKLRSGPAVKMTIKNEGWYRVTQQELVAAGFDTKVDPRRLQLYLEGAEQAILVRGEKDGSFDAGDAIEFFATGQDSAFTDAHVYWIVSGEGFGKRISAVKSKGKTGGPRSFAYTVERRDRTIYFSSLRNGEAENFFGAVVSSQPLDQTLTIPHFDMQSGEVAEVEIALQGVTDLRGAGPDHQVSVRLNGVGIGKLVFDGQTNKAEKYAVKPGLLIEGENVIRLESERGSDDVSLVDHIRLTYAHTYASDQDSLRMTAQSGRGQTIAGFASPAIRVVDISNPDLVAELMGTVQKQEDGYAVTVNVGGQGTRTLLAFTGNRVKRPALITLDRPSNWRSASNQANLLIVTRRDFFSALEPLKVLRESHGLRVALVDIEDVFDEFSYGEKTPQAIKDFISYAAADWNGKPGFVLFAGDASLDPRNYLGFGDNDIVPTRLVDTSLMETASDDWFADFKDDGRPELAMGRLPFRTADEAATMVSKIISYEGSGGSQEALLVADRNDEFDFESASAQVRDLMPSSLKVNQIDRGRVDAAKAKSQLIEALARGQKIVNYVGHGSANQWNGALLTNDDARRLSNRDRLPVFVMMTCLNGYFQDAAADSLAEALLKAEAGGAVAVWASTGLTGPNNQMAIDQELYRLLFSDAGNPTLGEAVRRAKRIASDSSIRRTWVLLGDPTMRLK